jgi:hypothetical protein
MASVTKGTAYLFGIDGTVANTRVQNFSINESFNNSTAVLDESGNEVSRRYDDVRQEVSCELIIASGYSIPAVGTQFTFNAVGYEITGVDKVESNSDHRKVTITGLKSEYISY